MSEARPERSYAHRTRLQKLAIKDGTRVAVVGFPDDELLREVESGLGIRVATAARGTYDAIVRLVEKPSHLAHVRRLREHLDPGGALWLVYRKGKGAPVPEREVIAAILQARLVDNKVISFSETHTATRAVIRIVDRPALRTTAQKPSRR